MKVRSISLIEHVSRMLTSPLICVSSGLVSFVQDHLQAMDPCNNPEVCLLPFPVSRVKD